MSERLNDRLVRSRTEFRRVNLGVWRTILVTLVIAVLMAGANVFPGSLRTVRANHKPSYSLAPVLLAQVGRESRDSVWQPAGDSAIELLANRVALPQSYSAQSLNQTALNELLAQVPMEFTSEAESKRVLMTLPMPDGSLAEFRIEQSPIMEPALAAQYPEIKTYRGQGIDDPTATTRFDWTPLGVHAIVLSARGTSFVEPLSENDATNYISYFNRDVSTDNLSLSCLLSESEMADAEARGIRLSQPPDSLALVTGSTLRTYRLAVAATGEFTQQYGGGSVSTTITKITTLINQINAIYQKEATITFQLIANEASIIFTDPATDGYTNGSPITMLGENQTKLGTVIGSANYDIGHVFGSISVGPSSVAFSGVASLGVVCVSGSKARGVSTMGGASSSFPHSIFVTATTHEFGHQFSAPHTFNSTTSGCSGQRSPSGAYEPGSGSTIMGYSICGSDNIQNLPDMYFHTGSLDQIVTYAAGGGNCAATSATGNGAPAISALSSFAIPANTPFTLTGNATDPDGDALTFSWEEFDLGNASPPNTDDGTRPLFRSLPPAASLSRTFPRLQYILNNANVPPANYACGSATCLTGEVLPSTTRTMNFRFTARDNRAAGGGTANASQQVSVVSSAGPFAVTQPNTGVNWAGNSNQTITWNVANTSVAPINAANVTISLSTDGGNTFPLVLSASTPNDGTQNVTIPNMPTSLARVKVEAAGNIFFDVSNANFTIVQGTGGATDTVGLYSPAPSNFFLRNSNTAGPGDVVFPYGPAASGWTSVVGDWNGDGVDTPGLYNPVSSTFFLKNTNSAGPAELVFVYGPAASGWTPIVGDWNGDGTYTVGLYDPVSSTFYLRNANSAGPGNLVFAYGPAASGWTPIVGDWNADGVDTIGLYNPITSTFFLKNTNSAGPGDLVFAYGPAGSGWKPLAGDWNGDGVDTIGLYNPSTAFFFLKNTNSAGPGDLVFVYGPAGAEWTPIVGDWDGL